MSQVLDGMLRHYISPKIDNWDEMLPVLGFAINNSYMESVLDAPFFMKYGRHLHVPNYLLVHDNPGNHPDAYSFLRAIGRAMERAKVCLKDAQQCPKTYVDAKCRDLEFSASDKAWLSSKSITVQGVGAPSCIHCG